MRLKLAIWGIIAVAVAGTLLAAAPTALKAARLHWPAWPVALAAALITALAGLVKPLTTVITKSWASRAQRQIERRDRARQIETDVTGRSKGLPLTGQITDRAMLGIHPAIPLPAGADPGLPFDLPLYIPRDIDAELHAWITAHQQAGGFLLLTGPAAAGKTRTAYELIRSTLSDWPLYMPGTPDQLISYISAGGPSTGKLIIWLNEIQNYLGPGGLTAAATRRVLAGPPVAIIIGTIWPERYDTLTSLPARATAPAEGAVSDPRGDAREILTILADRKDLRSAFTPGERHRAEELAPADPRITEALRHTGSPNLPETLAAVPDLISRWLTAADPYGAAVITAAVTARRCGHPPLLPPDLLQALAQAALTPAQRARAQPEWFTAALAWARTPVRGQAAPLTPQAATPAVIDGDHVSDVLVQHAASEPAAPWHQVPEPTWLLLISQAEPMASAYIANAARRYMHVHQAPITMCAIRKAADAGILQAMSNLAFLLYEQGDTEQAIHWFTKAADAGNQSAMSNLGILLHEQGDTGQAMHWLSKAVSGDAPAAMYNFGVVLDKQGDTEQAGHWWRKAAAAGHAGAMSSLGMLLHDRGDIDLAIDWYRNAGDDHNAMSNLAVLLRSQGEIAEAEHWWREAASGNHAEAMHNLGVLRYDQDDTGQAEHWWRKAAAAGYTGAMSNLGILLLSQGKTEEAEQWWRKAAADGNQAAIRNLRSLLELSGGDEEASMTANAAGPAEVTPSMPSATKPGTPGRAASAPGSGDRAPRSGEPPRG